MGMILLARHNTYRSIARGNSDSTVRPWAKNDEKTEGCSYAYNFKRLFYQETIFTGVPWVAILLPALLIEPLYLVAYIVGIICIGIMFFLLTHMKKRTAYGLEMLGKVQGFKNFLEPSENAKLEELEMDNQSYFYSILPYTYVLGVSDKWISKFENIVLQSPNWFLSSDPFNTFNAADFGRFLNSTMSSATSAMTSSPSSDSSGGGSSGGGSGGGGGGSW